MDDALGFGYEALDDGIELAVTANLNMDFRSPCPAGSMIRIAAYLTERTGRKLVWKVRVTSPPSSAAVSNDGDSDGDEVLYCEATSVYVIPKSHANS